MTSVHRIPLEDVKLIAWHYNLAHPENSPRTYVMHNGEALYAMDVLSLMAKTVEGVWKTFESLGISFKSLGEIFSQFLALFPDDALESKVWPQSDS